MVSYVGLIAARDDAKQTLEASMRCNLTLNLMPKYKGT
jgi:hypothetical protein